MIVFQMMQYALKNLLVWSVAENVVKQSMFGLAIAILIKVGSFGVIVKIVM